MFCTVGYSGTFDFAQRNLKNVFDSLSFLVREKKKVLDLKRGGGGLGRRPTNNVMVI